MYEYRVVILSGSTYQVERREQLDSYDNEWVNVHQGSLSDCEAFIRLSEQGYMK